MNKNLYMTIFVIFIHYIPLFICRWDYCYQDHRVWGHGNGNDIRIRDIPNLPCWGQCKKKPDTDINNNFDKAPDIQTSTNNLNGIADFNAIEMDSSYSDKYSFITDNPPPMDNCYQFLNSMKDNNITGAVSSSEKKQQTEFEKRLEDLQRERNL